MADTLLILPSLPVSEQDGRRFLTQKFVDGVEAFALRWPGSVHVHTSAIAELTDNLDSVPYDASVHGFSLTTGDLTELTLRPHLADAAAVLGATGHQQNHVAELCKTAGVPLAVVAEHTLRTRLQIAATEERNVLRRAYRSAWECGQELANRRAIGGAAGVQANGVPVFEAYRQISPIPILFYDSRVTREMVITEPALETRLADLDTDAPLRLGFSGRLIAMKGADHLIRVARELDQMMVPFSLTISGGGALESVMRRDTDRFGLSDKVHFNGVLDFATELVPFTKRNVDLYVICHRQGDPSCTYHETLACGVPFVGYANEALDGIVAREPVGQSTPMSDPRALAVAVAGLHRDRARLKALSRAARAFAVKHAFEDTMDARVGHLVTLAKAGGRL